MRILITGGSGLVGSHCAEYFARNNNQVIVLDNLMRSTLFGYDRESVEYNWNYLGQYENIERIKGDVRNESDVLKAIGDGVDAVIHTAGQPGVPLSIRIPKEDFCINALGTLNVLEILRQKSPRAAFIYTSTNKVYGENVDRIELEETDTRYRYIGCDGISEEMLTDLTGHTPYGVSKLVGDLYTQEYAHIYGMKTAVFRMSCTYGTRQFGFEDQGWVTWFIVANLLDKPVTLYGSGKQVRDLLYVTDLVRAFERFINSDLKHEIFNIGGGPENTVSLLEFLKETKRITGKETRVSFSNWRQSDQKVYISDTSRVKEKLGWAPGVGISEGIEKLLAWIKQNKGYFQ